MKYYETKIGKIIEEEFDSRLSNAVFSYIMHNGIDSTKKITDKEISKIKENGIMTKEVCQSLVRCARKICNECDWMEMIKFIRLHLCCKPTVHVLDLYREDFDYSQDAFKELLECLDLDDKEVGNVIKLYAIVDED